MEVERVYWWKHNCKDGQYSSAKVHRTVQIALKEGVSEPVSVDDYDIKVVNLPDLQP